MTLARTALTRMTLTRTALTRTALTRTGAHSDDPPANDSPLADTATRFLLAGARWHVLFVGLATVAALILGDPRLAAGLALGALLMYANLTMATRTLKRTFRGTGSVPQSPSAALAWATRWPLLALALVGILWYMPARPEGIALGRWTFLAQQRSRSPRPHQRRSQPWVNTTLGTRS